jgi:hypothetical protein
MFSETSKFLEFIRIEDNNQVQPNTPCVIGANEVYVDQRLKQKQQQQQQQQTQTLKNYLFFVFVCVYFITNK